MEEKVLKVIKKVKDSLCFQEKYRKVLVYPPRVTFYVEDNDFRFWSIEFNNGYESITINNKNVIYTPSNGQHETLVHFKNIDELLEM